jgi:hypothetical protein
MHHKNKESSAVGSSRLGVVQFKCSYDVFTLKYAQPCQIWGKDLKVAFSKAKTLAHFLQNPSNLV